MGRLKQLNKPLLYWESTDKKSILTIEVSSLHSVFIQQMFGSKLLA